MNEKIASMSAIEKARYAYWERVLIDLRKIHSKEGTFDNISSTKKSHIDGTYGLKGIHPFFRLNQKDKFTITGLWIDIKDTALNKIMFDVIYRHKDEIESKVSMPIKWDRKDNTKAACIYVQLSNADFSNIDDWDKMAEFHAKMSMELYEYIIKEYRDEIISIGKMKKRG